MASPTEAAIAAWLAWARTPAGRGALLYNAGYLALGCTLSMFGPVILDLAAQTGGSLRATGFCLTARSFAYLLGASCGPLYDRMPGHRLLALAMALCCAGTALIPAARSSAALAATVALQGAAMGLIDTGSNLLMLWWYGPAAGPYLQALHCVFGVGATAGPLLLRWVEAAGDVGQGVDAAGVRLAGVGTFAPAFHMTAVFCAAVCVGFVASASPEPRAEGGGGAAAAGGADAAAAAAPPAPPALGDKEVLRASESTAAWVEAVPGGSAAAWSEAMPGGKAVPGGVSETSVAVAAAPAAGGEMASSGAGAAVATGVAAAVTAAAPAAAVADTRAVAAAATAASVVAAAPGAAAPSALPAETATLERDTWRVVLLAALLLGVYVGAETGFGAYVTAYAVLALDVSEARGQFLAGAFWAAITVGRFASIWVSVMMPPGALLRGAMGASAASALLLLVAGGSEAGLWVGSLAFGLTMACVFPTTLSLVESYFPVLGRHATVLMIGSAAGEMVLPAIIAAAFGGAAEEGVPADAAAATPAAAAPAANPKSLLFIVAAACIGNVGVLLALQRAGESVAARRAEAAKAARAAGAAPP